MKNKILIIFGIVAAALTAFFLLNKKKTDEKLTANTATPKAPKKPIIPSTPITVDEQKFIDINGFEKASIIILKVADDRFLSGLTDMEVYTRKLNTPLKTNQMGWTRHGEEVHKKFNCDGSFYYTIVPDEPIEPPIQD